MGTEEVEQEKAQVVALFGDIVPGMGTEDFTYVKNATIDYCRFGDIVPGMGTEDCQRLKSTVYFNDLEI